MAEDVEHLEQACFEIKKMIDAISMAIDQLRQQQADDLARGGVHETFADTFSKKMLEDNEINLLKFMARYLCEKKKLNRIPGHTIPQKIAEYPNFEHWLKILGVPNLNKQSSDILSLPLEDILDSKETDLIEKFCASSEFGPFCRLIIQATENLHYYMGCLRSGTYCESHQLSWSRVDSTNASVKQDSGLLTKHHSKSLLPVSKMNQMRSKNIEPASSHERDPSFLKRLSEEAVGVSPLQGFTTLKPRIGAIGGEHGDTSTIRPSSISQDSRPSSSIPGDAEEMLALRTWKDIDGVVRRYSKGEKERRSIWTKFMTWSTRRHNHKHSPQRSASLTIDTNNSVTSPRRLESHSENNSSAKPHAKPRNKHTGPSRNCIIHVLNNHRIFLAKCDGCKRPMAFSCLICQLCKLRVHLSCANNVPHILLSSFARSKTTANRLPTNAQQTVPQKDSAGVESLQHEDDYLGRGSIRIIPHVDTIFGDSTFDNAVKPSNTVVEDVSISSLLKKDSTDDADDYERQRLNSYETRRRDSYSNDPYFSFTQKGTVDEPTLLKPGMGTVEEEGVSSPVSPSSNFFSPNHSILTSHIDSTGSSGCEVASPSSMVLSTPGSFTGKPFSRHPGRMSTISELSVALKEWLIPFKEITHGKHPIARGRYTTVYRGIWHGDVAVKVFHGLNEDDDKSNKAAFFSSDKLIQTFKDEVSILPKTRHENLVLFVGASIEKERLVIVSTFCKGQTLDSLIYSDNVTTSLRPVSGVANSLLHHSSTSPSQSAIDLTGTHLTTADSILHSATQIAQAVAYLHNKGILHKDLRLRNIFIEAKGRILLSDYGIFNATRIATNRHPDFLFVARTWLFGLAPELARTLRISSLSFALPDMGLEFTEKTDVFSFGCVWFELLHRIPPIPKPINNASKDLNSHVLIHQRGRCHLSDVKTPPVVTGLPAESTRQLLQACWDGDAAKRPRFADIIDSLSKISPVLATAAAAGIVGGGLASTAAQKRNGLQLATPSRMAHQPVRSPSQPTRGGSRANRALAYVFEPLTVNTESRK